MSLPPNVFGGLLNPLSGGVAITPPINDGILLEDLTFFLALEDGTSVFLLES